MTAYGCLVLDPPWAEYGGGGRGAQNHYALMKTSDIARAVLSSPMWRPAADAHLWCWVTDNFLPDGLALIERLGFIYKRTFCWVKVDRTKLQIGLGKYARGSHELCLFATRGATELPQKAPASVLFAPRREHSRKPDECHLDWYEAVSVGPRLEMFSRTNRPGWDAWGSETGKFSTAVAS